MVDKVLCRNRSTSKRRNLKTLVYVSKTACLRYIHLLLFYNYSRQTQIKEALFHNYFQIIVEQSIQLRHDRATMRHGRKNSLHHARSQQRRIYAERLHTLDQSDAAGSGQNRRKGHAKDARALKTAIINSRLPEKSSRDSRFHLILSNQARFVPSPLASGLASMSLRERQQARWL